MGANLVLVLAAVMWGLWGLFDKMAVMRAHPFIVQWMYSIPYIFFIPLWYYLGSRVPAAGNFNVQALGWAVAASVVSMLALLLMLFALQSKPASVTVAVTSAYPIVTLVLSVLTGAESFSVPKVLGILLVVGGVVLLQVNPT